MNERELLERIERKLFLVWAYVVWKLIVEWATALYMLVTR